MYWQKILLRLSVCGSSGEAISSMTTGQVYYQDLAHYVYKYKYIHGHISLLLPSMLQNKILIFISHLQSVVLLVHEIVLLCRRGSPLGMQFSCLSLPSSDVMGYSGLPGCYYFCTFVMYMSMYVSFWNCSLEGKAVEGQRVLYLRGVKCFCCWPSFGFFQNEGLCLMPNVLGTSYPDPQLPSRRRGLWDVFLIRWVI